MKQSQTHRLALHAVGEYIMNHIDGVMEMVQDTYALSKDKNLDEKTLVAIEEQVKAIANELTHQSEDGSTSQESE
jgi:hypothetical protein